MREDLFKISRSIIQAPVFSGRGGFAACPFVFTAVILAVVASLVGGCGGGRVAGDFYFSERSGYRFRLPGADWKMVGDGWKHRSELGYRTVYVEETYRYVTRRRETVVDNRKVVVEETTREIDEPAHFEQRDVFSVDIAFAYGDQDVRIIVAAGRMGDLFRYVRDYGVSVEPASYERIARAYFELFPSVVSWKGEHRLARAKEAGGGGVDYLELMGDGEVRGALAGRVVGKRLVLAYYRTGGAVPAPVLEGSRRDFMALVDSIMPSVEKPAS